MAKRNTIAKRAVVGLLALALSGGVQSAQAHRRESSWKPLKHDVSPGDLFARLQQEYTLESHGPFSARVLPMGFMFPKSTIVQPDNTPRTKPAVFGLDISHYQGRNFPFQALKPQNVSFVFIKATQGLKKDPLFRYNWARARALDAAHAIPVGAYHFLSSNPRLSGEAQADSFVDYVQLQGGFQDHGLPPAVDLEWDVSCRTCPDRWRTNHRTPEAIIKTTLAFVDRVKARTGRTPLLYTNKTWLHSVGIKDKEDIERITSHSINWIFDIDDATDLKLERPDPRGNLPSILWQFSNQAQLSEGYGGQLDVDIFQGSADQFQAILMDGGK